MREGDSGEIENLKSAITDHCRRNSHTGDWDKGKIITSDTYKLKRKIKEVIEFRRRESGTVNQDEGAAHPLAHPGFTSPETVQGRGGAAGSTGSDRSVESASM